MPSRTRGKARLAGAARRSLRRGGHARPPRNALARTARNQFARLAPGRALEVLGERRAKLLADPLKVTVDGVVTMDLQENPRGIERQIEQVRQAPRLRTTPVTTRRKTNS
ncbi:hypothetical protein ACFY9A_10590 [Streptomyces rubradiris]|uniref:hypothetical protein n=1 Tax=Streptomyces rubradiris TaxID=285531 RepID=UPI0036ED865F